MEKRRHSWDCSPLKLLVKYFLFCLCFYQSLSCSKYIANKKKKRRRKGLPRFAELSPPLFFFCSEAERASSQKKSSSPKRCAHPPRKRGEGGRRRVAVAIQIRFRCLAQVLLCMWNMFFTNFNAVSTFSLFAEKLARLDF